jgi:hypothetical protein
MLTFPLDGLIARQFYMRESREGYALSGKGYGGCAPRNLNSVSPSPDGREKGVRSDGEAIATLDKVGGDEGNGGSGWEALSP